MARRPNVLVIMDDQHQRDALGVAGRAGLATPHLDGLARQGLRLTRAYGQPTCTPSRVSALTGRLPHAHGAYSVGVDLPAGNPLLPRLLGQAGYRTCLVGKSHLSSWGGPDSPEQLRGATARWRGRHGPYEGFDRVHLSFGHGCWGASGHYRLWLYEQGLSDDDIHGLTRMRPAAGGGQVGAYDWDLPEELYDSTWATDTALTELRAMARGDEPFFLTVNYQGPHHPFLAPAGTALKADEVEVPVHVDGELDDKPRHYRAAREGRLEQEGFILDPELPMPGQNVGQDFRLVDDAWARQALARYHWMIEQIDGQVGRLLAELDALGLAEDTLVVFTSDHGELGGAHGLWMKGPFAYEETTAVPMLVRWPAGGLAGGREDGGLVSLADLAPTVLAAAGVPVPASMDGGVDLLPQWRDGVRVRDHVVTEYLDDPRVLCQASVITESWKLTGYLGGAYAGQDVGELYDTTGEVRNLWHDAGAAKARREHEELLERVVPPLARWRTPPRVGAV